MVAVIRIVFPCMLALLTACGGSGGGGGSSSSSSSSSSNSSSSSSGAAANPPATSPTPGLAFVATKTFRFSWTDVADATHYKLLENADGVSGYMQVETDIASGIQTADHVVPLYKRINAQYILQACNADGCTDSAPVTVSGNLAQAIGYFKASNPNGSDLFGYVLSLSADGNTLAVGTPFEDSNATGIDGDETDNSANDAGAVYIFIRDSLNGAWNQQAYIKAGNTDAEDYFGYTISLSADGNTLAVGAPQEDSDATGVNGEDEDDSAPLAGAAYLFIRDNNLWSQQAYIKASNTNETDLFGWAVSLSGDGNMLAVGARGEDSNATGIDGDQNSELGSASGAVYLYIRSGDNWSFQHYLKAGTNGEFDLFGSSLSLAADSNTLAVGAPYEDSNATGIGGNENDNSASEAGAVYLFVRSTLDGSWSQQAYIKASDTNAFDHFGWEGAVSLSADGDTLAVGAPANTAAYLFARNGNAWSQQALIDGAAGSEEFGSSLSLAGDGNMLAVGDRWEDSNATGINGDENNTGGNTAGAAFLFSRNETTWSRHAYIKASNTDSFDQFGTAVSLSGDGNTLAVGAIGEGSNSTGVNGDQSNSTSSALGAVYLY